jgi:hypothetical protein
LYAKVAGVSRENVYNVPAGYLACRAQLDITESQPSFIENATDEPAQAFVRGCGLLGLDQADPPAHEHSLP